MSPLVSRVVVSVVGLPIVLGIVYLGGWWLFVLAAVAAVLALHEYALMIRTLRPLILAAYAGALGSLLGAKLGGLEWTVAGFLSTIVLAFFLHWIASTRQSATVAIASTVLGAAWVGLGLAHVLLLRALPVNGRDSALPIFTVLLAVFAGDIAAFFAGRMLGTHRLAPTISPGKTWEGFIAGTVATVFVAFVALYKQDYISIGESLILGAVIAVAGPAGDLFESALKRDMQVKDSGRLLGGHGGMLDRLDAPLFAAVASYYVLRAVGAT
jgi:phosphatidate cytidylyltransferase